MHHPDCTYARYESLPGVRSHQLIDLFYGSPKLMQHRIWYPESPTPALQFGTWFHSALLENQYPQIIPDHGNGATKKAMASKINWMHSQLKTECPDLTKLSAIELRAQIASLQPQLDTLGTSYTDRDTFDVLQAMCDSAHAHPQISQYLEVGRVEQTITAAVSNVACKARIDVVVHDETRPTIIDVKTVPSLSAVRQSVYRYHYPFQLEFYRRVYCQEYKDYPHCLLICIEKEPPYDAAVFAFDEGIIEQAQLEVERALHTYRQCVDAHFWPGYGWSWATQRYEVTPL